MPIIEPQASLRRKLADDLRTDSRIIQEHLNLEAYLASDAGDGTLWSDTHTFSIRDIRIGIDFGASLHKEANARLIGALESKVQQMLPDLCREILAESAVNAEVASRRHSHLSSREGDDLAQLLR